jgi:hypothetical protein
MQGNEMQEDVRDLRLIEDDARNIRLIEDPTEDEQLLAVNNDPQSIQYIKNPLPSVMERAVELDPTTIQYAISLASRELRLQAIERNPKVIQFYTDSTLQEQKVALTLDEETIDLIRNRSAWTDIIYIIFNYKTAFFP